MLPRAFWIGRLVFCLPLVWFFGGAAPVHAATQGIVPIAVTAETANDVCLQCHGIRGFAVPQGETGESAKRQLALNAGAFAASAHGNQRCVACHTDIREMPHATGVQRTVDCVQCHAETLKAEAAKPRDEPERVRIGNVVYEVGNYLASVHAQPRKDNPARPNATCVDCHDAHYVFPMNSRAGLAYRLTTPAVCGRCHEKEQGLYASSVHGAAVLRLGKPDAATCADCHTAHRISKTSEDPAKLLITQNCGNCHENEYETYRSTYHGQVNALGYTHTAKCFDCHENHATLKVDDPSSKVSGSNRLKTCQQCHAKASMGFISFYPHGNTHDFNKYPAMWLASKAMILLLAGVFAFFWTHSAMWFYREWKDQKEGKNHILVDADGNPVRIPPPPPGTEDKYVLRFPPCGAGAICYWPSRLWDWS